MSHVSEEIMEDIALLLEDCSTVFRQHHANEQEKLAGTLSLVEVETATKEAIKYHMLADACDKYALIARPTPESR